MKKLTLRFLSLVILMTIGLVSAKAAEPTVYTSNVSLSTTNGTNASTAKVKINDVEYDALKVGTGKLGGSLVITVPANTTTLTFHAAAWNGVTGLSLNITGATVSPASVALTANSGVSNASPFTVTPDNNNEFFSIDLTDITVETDLTFTTSLAKRFVMWGVNAEVSAGGVSVTKPVFNPDGGVVAIGSVVTVTATETVYVANETVVGALPTAKAVLTNGTQTNSITVDADATYYAVAVDNEGNKSSVAKAAFTVIYHAGTEADPYTVADAIKVANAAGTTSTAESYYVEGYVCTTPTASGEQYTFSMTDNEDFSGDQLKAYRVSYTGSIKQGDKVVVCGPLCMYYSTPEINTGSVTNVTGKLDAEIAWNADACTWRIDVSTAGDLPTLANPHSVGIDYKSSNTDVATIDAAGTVTIVAEGTTTITATVQVNATYKVSSVSYDLTVVDPSKIRDVLDVNTIPDFTSSYKDYLYTTSNGLTYEVFGYKSGGIQINANKEANYPSGIVVTKNSKDYAVKSIKIALSSVNSSVPVYVIGSNKIYTGTSDIANSDTRDSNLGTLLQEITTAGTYDIIPGDEYRYICICPSKRTSGASVITSVTIEWTEATTPLDYPTVAISDKKYASMYYGDTSLILPDGVKAFTYSISGNTAVATESYAAGDIIPAEEGVLLYSETPGDYTFVETVTTPAKVAENCLRGTDETTTVTAVGEQTLYILAEGDKGLGFYIAYPTSGNSFTNGAHKAYLEVPVARGSAPARIALPVNGDDEVVGIFGIVNDENDDNAPAYNVMGQKVGNDYKGLVIKNGKKFVNK